MLKRWSIMGLMMLAGLSGIQGMAAQAFAEGNEKPWVSKIISLQGRATINRQGEADWVPAALNDTLFPGDRLQVEEKSRAGIVLRNDAVLRLDQNTTLVFTEIEQKTTFIFKLLKGAANFFSHRPRSLKIFTPFVNGVVEGTEFYVQVDAYQTRIDLFEGRIRAENEHGELQLVKGQGAVATIDTAPQRRILVQPRDSVQWALYYPPVLTLGQAEAPDEIGDSLKAFNQGRPLDAVDGLNQVAEEDRDSTFYAYRAGLLLQLGRVTQARDDLQQSLAMDPDNREAMALRAIIAVVQNQKEEALAIAQKAVQRSSSSATALIALSYAQQAAFNLPQALDAAQAAVAQAPESSTARSRLAELHLSTGALGRGVEAARKAVDLNPLAAHAHTILGFAYLTQIKTEKAIAVFEKSITLDSAAPLPRLGLGLAKIRDGDLKQGRGQIEIAAGLDPGNALIRSYLGKAYFDEKRGGLDQEQLEIAKRLDPNDPTPWFYDAIRKQSLNRPGEALQDLQKSIKLNNNRAVYRSRLLLDEDLAARSASLGKIYNDLDFQQLALTEGYKSLNVDSTNYSAHRLLADTYAARPRHEIARVSELLQAQLFQPINLTPIQAHLAESDTPFFDVAGPAALSFNEYNPLFTRNRAALQASGVIASNETWAHEITASGVLDKVSASVGEFHYQSDGIRENNDYTQDLADLFLQGSLTSKTHLQVEYRYSELERGDRTQNFDSGFSTVFREKESVRKLRIGGRHVFSKRVEMIASIVHTDLNINTSDMVTGFPGSSSIRDQKRDGYLAEVRNDYKSQRFSVVTGIGYLDEDQKTTTKGNLGPPFFFPLPEIDEDAEIIKSNGYFYSYIRPSNLIELTIGFSADILERGEQIDTRQFNPKLGFLWQPGAGTTLRLAAFRALSNTNLSAQTIEPTHVAGFNQLYDDRYGSDVWNFGVALSHEFTDQLMGGIDFTKRLLEAPRFGDASDRAVYFSWEEYLGSAYLYWMPHDYLAISGGYHYERFDREENPLGLGISEVTTHKFPIGIKFFHPVGFSFGMKASYYLQDGEFLSPGSSDIFSGSDNFWVVDAELSYRLPKRYGVLSIGAKNLFDEEFRYQSTDLSNPTISPSASIFGKITLSF